VSGETPRIPLSALRAAAMASDAERAAHGIPPRPRGNVELLRKWLDAFGRPAGVVAAQLKPSARMRSHPCMRSVINSVDSSNWSGVVATPPAGETISVAVSGVWNAPNVESLGSGQQRVAAWIGIDGFSQTQTPIPLLQAGISVVVNPTGAPVYSAWAEWSGATTVERPQEIDNFSVAAGDFVEVQIWMTSTTTETVAMRNLTTNPQGPAVIVPIANPADAHILGLTAEWIVERPAEATAPMVEFTLADYSPVTFTEAMAWAQPQTAAGSNAPLSLTSYAHGHGFALPASARTMAASADAPSPTSLRALMRETVTVYAGAGTTITMTEDGTTLSTATILSNQSLQCQYAGPQPS
jgi:Peptidase A4 family